MKQNVFITKTGSYFPNHAVRNEEMDEYIGLICEQQSRVKNVVLRQNGIKERYYALDKNHQPTHTNAELAVNAIDKLFDSGLKSADIDLLTCASSSPDQTLPSQASMVHGLLKNKPMEIYSASGVCLSSLQAFKTAYLSLICGDKKNAVCSTSELVSPSLLSKFYNKEYGDWKKLDKEPYMAFEKDFLRYMLSDGASCVFMEIEPHAPVSLRVDWIEMLSYANELPTCMFAGAERREDGELKSWKFFEAEDLIDRSLFAVKQDVKLLKKYICRYWVDFVLYCLEKNHIRPSDITYVLPHVSSMFIYHELEKEFAKRRVDLLSDRWYTNLPTIGNVASAAIFAALDEFWKTRELGNGDKILLLVPESGRFSFGAALLTVVKS